MSHFRIQTVEITPEVSQLRIGGTVDASNIMMLKTAIDVLFGKGVYKLLVDLKEAEWVSSSGFGFFITSLDIAREHGGNIVFVPAPTQIRLIADLLGLSGVLSCADDIEMGLAMLGGA